MRILLICILLLFLNVSCFDKFDTRDLEIINHSDRNIYSILHKINIEEDTINTYGFFGDFRDSIEKNARKAIMGPSDWKWYMRKSMGHRFRLYIIKKDSVEKYGWQGIHLESLYNKKYLLDLDNLDSLNWMIEYYGE